MVFMATDMQHATNTFCHDSGRAIAAGAFSMPSEARKTGTPEANIVMAMLMPIPRMPHTSARGAMPKPGRL